MSKAISVDIVACTFAKSYYLLPVKNDIGSTALSCCSLAAIISPKR
nr:MAG TPA: hypothetical protein [Caudoviricetes sp.]DAV09585.1 MAG TPA: hypothetical protein [Caudoviricetes sp.]